MPTQELRRQAQWSATTLMENAAAVSLLPSGHFQASSRHAWPGTRDVRAASALTHRFSKFEAPMLKRA
jgi:hypothetical protein